MQFAAKKPLITGTGACDEVSPGPVTRNSRCKAIVDARRVRLTERDLWIIEALAKMRFLKTSQLAKLYFRMSRWSTNKRLRKLLDAGLIKAWVRNLAEENIYSITQDGMSRVDRAGICLQAELKCPKRLDENFDHLIAINDVRISLALGLSEAHGEIIWWRSDWELRSHGRGRIIPDSLFVIKWEDLQEQAYALEVDNNTRSSRNFLKKILTYRTLQRSGQAIYGIPNPVVLVAGVDANWLERYRLSLRQIGLPSRVWFCSLDQIVEKGAVNSIWQGSNTEEKHSLRELTSLPYRKETFFPKLRDSKGVSDQNIGRIIR